MKIEINTLLPVSSKIELEKYKPIRQPNEARDANYSPQHDAIMTAIWDRLQEFGNKEVADNIWTSSLFPERLTKQILRIIEQSS